MIQKIKICSLLLGLLFNSELFAKSFIQAIDLKKDTMNFSMLVEKVSKHRWFTRNYLSLGESHLHPNTSRPVLLKLAKNFLEDTPFHKKLCSENISSFLTTYPGREIQRLSHAVDIYQGNNPSRTDFKKCFEKDSELVITYSGFFHQHPFAKSFPEDFIATPVISDPKNNIRAQLPKGKGLFVTLMELDHLEMTTSQYILKKKITDVNQFRSMVTKLTKKLMLIRANMEVLLEANSSWRTKSGIILDQNHFENKEVLPFNTFIILTDINSRFKTKPLKLLNDLADLSDNSLEKYLKFISEERSYYTSSFFEPADDGTLSPTGYGTYSMRFPGGSSFLDLIHPNKKSILLVSSASTKKINCFTKSNDVVIELDCENIFLD